jgi:hypothetical protein
MAAPTGRFRRPIGRNRLKFLAARFLRHPMLKSSSFRTVWLIYARGRRARLGGKTYLEPSRSNVSVI